MGDLTTMPKLATAKTTEALRPIDDLDKDHITQEDFLDLTYLMGKHFISGN